MGTFALIDLRAHTPVEANATGAGVVDGSRGNCVCGGGHETGQGFAKLCAFVRTDPEPISGNPRVCLLYLLTRSLDRCTRTLDIVVHQEPSNQVVHIEMLPTLKCQQRTLPDYCDYLIDCAKHARAHTHTHK